MVAAASFEAATGIVAAPIAQLAKGHMAGDESKGTVVVAEAHRFGPWELAWVLEQAIERGGKAVLFAPSVSLEARFSPASRLAPELEAFVPPAQVRRASPEGRESHLFAGREVVVVNSGAQARQALLTIWGRERALGGRALIAASDDSVVAHLREAVVSAGGSSGEVVEARRLDAVLAEEKDAPSALTRIATLGTLPELRRARSDRFVHVGVVGEHLAPTVRLARAAELARPPYLVSELGTVPAAPADREVWRRGAAVIESFRRRWSIEDKEHAFGDKSTLRSLDVVAYGEAVEASVKARQLRRSMGAQSPGLARRPAERAMSR
jgi:hypothetical protein